MTEANPFALVVDERRLSDGQVPRLPTTASNQRETASCSGQMRNRPSPCAHCRRRPALA
jgi:hypothetical protein